MDKLSDNGLLHAEDFYYLLSTEKNIRILDATYALPGSGKNPFQAYLSRHIEGAQFFDIDVVADQESALPHMLPSPDYFAACASALGISNDDHVVIYDQSGCYMASARVWWMFRTFGHERVYVMEGGLYSWVARGFRTVEGAPEAPEPTHYTARFRPELVVSRNDLMDNLETKKTLVLDARSAERFAGEAPEPRAGLRAGHIPGSYNLPFSDVLDGRSSHFKDGEALEQTFSSLDIAPDANVAVSCGSGVTACTVALALFKARGQEAAVYDGSWSEWGDELAGTPVEVSA